MSGIVFAPGSLTEGKYSPVVNLTAGQLIPPGTWYIAGAYTLTVPNAPPATGTATLSYAAGYVESDGTNATITAAGTATKQGAGNPGQWPWLPPWPLPGHG